MPKGHQIPHSWKVSFFFLSMRGEHAFSTSTYYYIFDSNFRVFGRNEGFKKVFKFDCPVARPFKLLVSNDKSLLAILSIDRAKNKECVNVYHSRKGILLHRIILK